MKDDILREADCSPYTVHPGENKMHQDLKKSYWWKRMKVDVARYVAYANELRLSVSILLENCNH